MAKAQKDLSRKSKGSERRRKARAKLARIHEKVANVREDHLHQESARLVANSRIIATEKLNNWLKENNHDARYMTLFSKFSLSRHAYEQIDKIVFVDKYDIINFQKYIIVSFSNTHFINLTRLKTSGAFFTDQKLSVAIW